MFEAAATSISSTYRLVDGDLRPIRRVRFIKGILPVAGGLVGAAVGALGLPPNDVQIVSWVIEAMQLLAPFIVLFGFAFWLTGNLNLSVMPGVDAYWYRLSVGESTLTTEDDTVIQIQRYDRFRYYQTTETMLVLYRANRSFVPIPLDRVPEDVRRKLLNQLTQAGVSESQTSSLLVRAAIFAVPAVLMFVLFGTHPNA